MYEHPRTIYTQRQLFHQDTSLSPAPRKVLMNLETECISFHETGNTGLRQCKRIHKRSRRRPGYLGTNNNRLPARLYLQTVTEEEALLPELRKPFEIIVSIGLLRRRFSKLLAN